METALITVGGMLIAAALGFFFKAITGENRAAVRKLYADVVSSDANASSTYMEAARSAAAMMNELQNQVKSLTTRVDTLEEEKNKLEKEIGLLQAENKLLKEILDVRGIRLP